MDYFSTTIMDEWQGEQGAVSVTRSEWADSDGAGTAVWIRTDAGDVEVSPADVPRLVAALQSAASEQAPESTLTA